jgi:hypothetical protein
MEELVGRGTGIPKWVSKVDEGLDEGWQEWGGRQLFQALVQAFLAQAKAPS